MNEAYTNLAPQNASVQVPIQPNLQYSQIPNQPLNVQLQDQYLLNRVPVYHDAQHNYETSAQQSNQTSDGYFDGYGNFHFHNKQNH